MKILFSTRHFGYLRNFESVVVELAGRGHRLHLVADRDDGGDASAMVDALTRRCDGVTAGRTPARTDPEWLDFATALRLTHDCLRYVDRRYDEAPRIRQRSRERTPAWGLALVRAAERLGGPGTAALGRMLGAIERAVPVPDVYHAFLREQAPDVVILTPLIDLGSPQLDLLKAAKACGLRTVLAVGSWDHLSSKALIRLRPDVITVWNEVQKREAIEMHGVPGAQVVVTGAQCYDQWFGRPVSRDRATFCRDVGLPAERPYLLYVCSSPFRGEPPEPELVERWLAGLRASGDRRLREIGVLIRPHPGRVREWDGRNLSSMGPLALNGRNPVDEAARADYFDALAHSTAVVGLNTSAFLEAAIAGRPVHVILPPEHTESQEGTLHFHYLTTVGGGLVRIARSFEEHFAGLVDVLDHPPAPNLHRAFLEAFLRPHGLETAATPRFADAIEALGGRPASRPGRPGWIVPVIAPILRTVVSRRRGRSRRRQAARLVDARGPHLESRADHDRAAKVG